MEVKHLHFAPIKCDATRTHYLASGKNGSTRMAFLCKDGLETCRVLETHLWHQSEHQTVKQRNYMAMVFTRTEPTGTLAFSPFWVRVVFLGWLYFTQANMLMKVNMQEVCFAL